VNIKEGEKERLQALEGTLIMRKNIGLGENITAGTWRVRWSRLYYLHGLCGTATCWRERT
jgi:ribosomal protein L19